MSQERMEILRMLSEGKITAEEAEMLLRAVSNSSEAREQPGAKGQKFKEMTQIFQDIGQEIKQEISKAVGSMQRSDVSKIVSDVVSEVSNVVGDVVEEVKSSVSDTIDVAEGAGKRKVEEQLEWTFDGAGVSRIDAQTVNGSISLEGSERDQVIVRALKEVRARSAADAEEFARQVQVYAEQDGDEIQISREHPKPRKGINVTVSYEIESPRTVDVNLRTVNNKIQISGIDGSIDAATVNSNIELQGDTGPIDVHTINGNIEASVGFIANESAFSTTNGSINVKVCDGAAPLTAKTTNGSIDLTLPADFSGQLDAKTTNGCVDSDFPIPPTGKSKKRLEGQIGEGGEAVVKIRSLNGGIHLRAQQ